MTQINLQKTPDKDTEGIEIVIFSMKDGGKIGVPVLQAWDFMRENEDKIFIKQQTWNNAAFDEDLDAI